MSSTSGRKARTAHCPIIEKEVRLTGQEVLLRGTSEKATVRKTCSEQLQGHLRCPMVLQPERTPPAGCPLDKF